MALERNFGSQRKESLPAIKQAASDAKRRKTRSDEHIKTIDPDIKTVVNSSSQTTESRWSNDDSEYEAAKKKINYYRDRALSAEDRVHKLNDRIKILHNNNSSLTRKWNDEKINSMSLTRMLEEEKKTVRPCIECEVRKRQEEISQRLEGNSNRSSYTEYSRERPHNQFRGGYGNRGRGGWSYTPKNYNYYKY